MTKYILLSVISLCCQLTMFAQHELKKNSNTKPYPFGNPVITHMYTADAAPKVMPDGKVWMVTSVDHEYGGGYATMHKYHTFSSSDMVNWTDHGEVFNVYDAKGSANEPDTEDWALWAPDMIYFQGKYHLYYPVRIKDDALANAQGNNGRSYIAVAVSDHPAKRFTVLNPKIEGTSGIDPAVFIDDDGQPYLFWGNKMGARLKDNMCELAEKPRQIDLDTDRFMEAIWMHKHEGKYYINYHTLYDWKLAITEENMADPNRNKSELAYSVSDHIMGPYTFKGTLNYEPGQGLDYSKTCLRSEAFVPWRTTLSNHGGIVEYNGKDYLFYHTPALS